MPDPLRILIVEDSADDAEVALLELARGGVAPDARRVETAAELRAALADGPWDAVLSDYTVPGFGAAEAFALCREADPDLPFVVVSGTIGEQRAVEMMRAGAGDYLLKGNLARLPAAVEREVRGAEGRRARRRAEQSAALLASVVESSDDAILSKSLDGVVTSWNPGAERLFGWAAAEALGRHVSFLVPPDRAEELARAMDRLGRGERVPSFETVRLRKGGARIEVAVTASPLHGPDGRLVGYSWIVRDIGDRKRGEAAQARAALVLANVRDAVVVTDPDGVVTDWNDGATRLFGWAAGEMLGRHYADRHPESARAFVADEVRKLAEGGEAGWEFEDWRKDGSRVWVEARVSRITDPAGRAAGVLGVYHDVGDRKRAEDRLSEYQLTLEGANAMLKVLIATDGLTGTNTRAAFDAELAEEFGRATRRAGPMSLLLLDVDHFKRFNDTFGHPAGDAVLRAVAATLRATARASDTVARYGGEEFAVILPDTGHSGAMVVAERFRRAVAGRGGDDRGVTVSVGVATLTPSITDAAMMVTEADHGLYQSKHAGRNRVRHGGGAAAALATPV